MQRGGPTAPARLETRSEWGHVSNRKVKASRFLEGRGREAGNSWWVASASGALAWPGAESLPQTWDCG